MHQAVAEQIGAYALEILFILLLIILGSTLLLWYLFEKYHPKLWELGKRIWRYIRTLTITQWLGRQVPWLWPFLKGRLSPQGYLGLHLTIGLLVSFVGLNIFGSLAEVVLESEWLVRFDQALANALHHHAQPFGVTFFSIITSLAGRWATIIVGIGVGLILLFYQARLLLASWIITLLGGSLLSTILKMIYQRARPEFENPFLVETNWSFPSGHAMGSLIIYGMLTYLLMILLNRYMEKVILIAAIALVLLIGFSRMYLGVHYFSDIIAGYAVGTAWLAITISGTEVARRHKKWQQVQKLDMQLQEVNE